MEIAEDGFGDPEAPAVQESPFTAVDLCFHRGGLQVQVFGFAAVEEGDLSKDTDARLGPVQFDPYFQSHGNRKRRSLSVVTLGWMALADEAIKLAHRELTEALRLLSEQPPQWNDPPASQWS